MATTQSGRHSTTGWRRPQFSLRTFLVFITLVAAYAAAYARYAPQRQFAKACIQRGGKVTYHPPLFHLPERFAWSLRDVRSVDLSRRPLRPEDLEALPRLPRLEALYLARCEITDSVAQTIGFCRELRRLALWNTNLYDAQVTHLARLSHLELLDIHDTQVTDQCLTTLSRLPALRELRFNFPLSDAGIESLAASQLRLPETVSFWQVTDAGLRTFEQLDASQTRLVSLESHAVTGDALVRLFQRCPPSETVRCNVRLSGRQLTAEFLGQIPLDRLATLALDGTQVRPRDLAQQLAGRTIHLDLSSSWVMFHPSVSRPFQPLEPTSWYGANASDDGLTDCLPWLESVTHLSLYKSERLPVQGRLRRLTGLRHVSTTGPLPAGFLEELSHVPQLESIDIAWNGGVEPQPLEPLTRLTRLRRVRFTATPFTAEQIRPLGEIGSLVELELHACHFPRSTLAAFPNFRQLKVRMSPATGPKANQIEEE